MSVTAHRKGVELAKQVCAELPALCTAEETAQVFRVQVRTIKSWLAQGRMASLRPVEGGASRVLVPRVEIERLLTEVMR